MKGKGELTQYGMSGTFATMVVLMVSLILSALRFENVYAQPRCDQAKQRIYRITETEAQQVPDSLKTVLDLIAFVRDCEDDVSLELEPWLLNNEVFVFNELEQYDEALALVDRFFATYFNDASDIYRARFHLWRMHFRALNGNTLAMLKDYAEAQKYARALDATHRASLALDGAHAYLGIKEYETALELAQEALELISAPETYEERKVTARALLIGAESRFWLSRQLEEVKADLRDAADLYGALGDTSKVAIATTLLGMTYASEGDTSRALTEMITATVLAGASGDMRSRTYALWRQGQLLREAGELNASKSILLQALEVAETYREFYLVVAYELAMLFEQRHELDRATHYYRTIVDAPRPSRFAAALDAERTAHAAQIRLLLIESHRHQTRFYFALSGLLMVLAGGGVFFLFLKRRRSPEPSLVEKKSNGVFIPRKMPTGLSLEALEQRFVQAIDALKLGRRLAWVYAVLLDTALVLPFIHDEYLARQVEAYDVENNTALFQCVASVEEARTGESFSGRAENTLASYLRGEFERRAWDWPKNPLAWKLFFTKYHVDTLFE